MIESFDKLGLNQNLIEGLKQEGINKTNRYSNKGNTFYLLENKDIIGSITNWKWKRHLHIYFLYFKK